MIVKFSDLMGFGVYEQNAPKDIVAIVRDVVVDPDTGKVVGLWVSGMLGLQILLPSDIESWVAGKILIASESFFQFPDKLPRLSSVFEREVPIIGATVWAGQKKIGTVKNFLYQSIDGMLLSIMSKRHWFAKKQVIMRYQILKISERGIEVDLEKTAADIAEAEALMSQSLTPAAEAKID